MTGLQKIKNESKDKEALRSINTKINRWQRYQIKRQPYLKHGVRYQCWENILTTYFNEIPSTGQGNSVL